MLFKIKDALRMWPMYIIATLLFVAVAYLSSRQIGLILFKWSVLTGALVLGYIGDRLAFPYGRPDRVRIEMRHHMMYRRMGIMASCVIAAGLAV